MNSQDKNDWRDTSLDTSLLICQAFYRHLSGIFITVDIIVISNNFIKITLFCVYFLYFSPPANIVAESESCRNGILINY